VSEFEKPDRKPTVEDVRQLMGASTPHFALQIRNRIRNLIQELPPEDPARLEGEREIARLTTLGYTGEVRGTPHEDTITPLPSLGGDATVRRGTGIDTLAHEADFAHEGDWSAEHGA
jgi:hypothetical protein